MYTFKSISIGEMKEGELDDNGYSEMEYIYSSFYKWGKAYFKDGYFCIEISGTIQSVEYTAEGDKYVLNLSATNETAGSLGGDSYSEAYLNFNDTSLTYTQINYIAQGGT